MKKHIRLAALILGAVVTASSAWADEPAGKKWKNAAEVSVVSTNGNSKTNTSSAKDTYQYQWDKTILELIGSGLGAKNNGVVTAEQYNASEKLSYKLTDKNYTFEKFNWDKNRFAGVRNRYDSSVGFGRDLVANSTEKLIGELGGGYVIEERVNSPTEKFSQGRVYSKYTHKISPTSNVSQDVEYLPSLEDKDDYRVNTETALTAAISTHFSMKVAYNWKYVATPPPGFGRNDTSFTVALVANY